MATSIKDTAPTLWPRHAQRLLIAYGCLNVDSIARHLTFWWTDIELPFWWCEIAYTTYCVINNAVISDSHRVEKFWITLRWTRHRIDVRIRFGHSKRLAPNHNQYPFYDNNFGTSKNFSLFVIETELVPISTSFKSTRFFFSETTIDVWWRHNDRWMSTFLQMSTRHVYLKKTRMNKDFQICTFLFL